MGFDADELTFVHHKTNSEPPRAVSNCKAHCRIAPSLVPHYGTCMYAALRKIELSL